MDVVVTEDPDRNAYVATLDGREAGRLEYLSTKGPRVLSHTEVDVRYEGKGVGGALARFALDQARTDGTKVLVTCPFVIDWLRRHRDYLDVVYQNAPQEG